MKPITALRLDRGDGCGGHPQVIFESRRNLTEQPLLIGIDHRLEFSNTVAEVDYCRQAPNIELVNRLTAIATIHPPVGLFGYLLEGRLHLCQQHRLGRLFASPRRGGDRGDHSQRDRQTDQDQRPDQQTRVQPGAAAGRVGLGKHSLNIGASVGGIERTSSGTSGPTNLPPMLEAMLWGLIQGLTEFLPISSSGHLVLVPAFLGVEPPDLATSALLHLGTLIAVLAYYRHDLIKLVHFRRDAEARRILTLLIIGTIPATVGIALTKQLSSFQESTTAVAVALLVTGVVLVASGFITRRARTLENASLSDALLVGVAQATALLPGISRSGMTITAALGRGLSSVEAARFSFLLAVPAIAGGGLIEMVEMLDGGGIPSDVWIGVLVAAVSGYLAIAFLIKTLVRLGLRPFAVYCFVVGTLALVVL